MDKDKKIALGLGVAILGLAGYCWWREQREPEGLIPGVALSPQEPQFVPSGKEDLPASLRQDELPPPIEIPKAVMDTAPIEQSSGDILLFDRPAFVLAPADIKADTPVLVLLHGGRGEHGKAHTLGAAALEGTTLQNLLSIEGASDQVLAIIGRQAAQEGQVVVYLSAKQGEQWSKDDFDYIRSALSEMKKRLGTSGQVKVSGMAAGLLAAGEIMHWIKSTTSNAA